MLTEFERQVPVVNQGFGVAQTHYASGRIAAAVAAHGGMTEIRYNGTQNHTKNLFFSGNAVSCWNKLFKLQIILDEDVYYPEFNRTHHYPFGYASECTLAGVTLRHELVLDQTTLFQRLTVLDNPSGRAVGARVLQHGHLGAAAGNRCWEPWTIDEATGALRTTVTDSEEEGETAATTIRFSCNIPCNTTTRHGTFKYYLETKEAADVILFALAFDGEEASALNSDRLDHVYESYESMVANGIRFDTGNPVLDSALTNAAPMVAHLAVADAPGAIRASQSYWVWGWDGMVHAEALLYNGQAGLVRDMLDFYRTSADPEKGIGHAFNGDLSYFQPANMAANAQLLYGAMLHNYYAVTGDRETVERNLPFARELIARAKKSLSDEYGLAVGFGFFPDDRWALGHNRKDLSLINNSLFYQGLQAMGAIEEEFGHAQESTACRELAGRIKSAMESILWDEEKGYWLDSASSEDGSVRHHYPLYGQLFVSPFGDEPGVERQERIAAFMTENFLFDLGLTMFPTWDKGFMADGNQLGAYYPPVDRYYWNLMNATGRGEAATDFERIVTTFWREHTYPEGYTRETVNADPTFDNPGGKQAFSAKSWFCDALELHLGLRVGLQGLTLNPLPAAAPFRIGNLKLRDKRIDIERSGDGRNPQFVLNGSIVAEGRFAWDQLAETNLIQIEMR